MSTSKLSNELTETKEEWTLAEYRDVLNSYYAAMTDHHMYELDYIKAAYKVNAHENNLTPQLDLIDINMRAELNTVSTEFTNALQILETTLESGADPVSAHRSMHDAMDKWNKADEKAEELFKERCPLVINSYCSSENGFHCWFEKPCIRRARADGTPLPEDAVLVKAGLLPRKGCLTDYTEDQKQALENENVTLLPCDYKALYCV